MYCPKRSHSQGQPVNNIAVLVSNTDWSAVYFCFLSHSNSGSEPPLDQTSGSRERFITAGTQTAPRSALLCTQPRPPARPPRLTSAALRLLLLRRWAGCAADTARSAMLCDVMFPPPVPSPGWSCHHASSYCTYNRDGSCLPSWWRLLRARSLMLFLSFYFIL